jgi:single-strand DNA-binding protein
MSRTLNKVMLIGNVGNDPDYRMAPNNVPVASFRLATSQIWKDKDGSVKEHTDWHTIVGWRGLADVIDKLVRKGSKIYVEGKIRNRKIESGGSAKKQTYEIIAESILILEQKKTKSEIGDDDYLDSNEEILYDASMGDTPDLNDLRKDSEKHDDEGKERNVDTFLF